MQDWNTTGKRVQLVDRQAQKSSGKATVVPVNPAGTLDRKSWQGIQAVGQEVLLGRMPRKEEPGTKEASAIRLPGSRTFEKPQKLGQWLESGHE